MSTIELIGSIDKQHYYEPVYIASLLASDRKTLRIGEDFTGRIETRIYANEQDVVKIRAELKFNSIKAQQWTANILQQEREIAVHHPHKTWFIVSDTGAENVLVGSICPRLRPVHIELKTEPKSLLVQQRYLFILKAVFNQYLLLAKTSGFKLDEGLSNFAVDERDAIFYLDDEFYSWDNFVSFSVMLGVFIRSFAWLNKDFIRQLTQILVRLIDEIFQDPHCRIMISTQLQSLFMPSVQKQQLLSEVINGLSNIPISGSKITRKKTNDRYFAIMADIHANEVALDCVLAFFRERNINQGIILGDIVGYGPDPRICIEKAQECPFEIIKGNHDHAVAMANTDIGFSNNAKTIINWTIDQLDQTHRDWLKYLPSFAQQKDWLAVHGAPIDPAFFYGYVYLMTAEDNLDYLQEKEINMCFHGHSHMPGMYTRDKYNFDRHLTASQIQLTKYRNMLICPGSVGQPRNGNPDTQCAIFDRENKVIDFISISYPVDSVIQRMKKNNFPDQLWKRLKTGN